MNKVLHGLVYVFLVLSAAALYFELQLNDKRGELKDRNRLQEDYLVRLAKTIEKADPDKGAAFEIKMDASPVEAKIVDSPDMENVLDEYNASLEQANLETYNWDSVRDQLRNAYVLGADGKPVMDGSDPQTRDSDEDKLLSKLFESSKTQQSRLNSTRAALTELRGKLESVVNEINKLKPIARQALIDANDKDGKIKTLEEEKAGLAAQITKIKGQIDELNGEIASLKDEVSTAKDETEAKAEELAKAQQLNAQLKQMLQNSIQTAATPQGAQSTANAVATLPTGDKGKIVEADNDNMFAIVEFTAEALKELKGEDGKGALPAMEFGVRRAGFKGPAGEFVGRIRLRQEVKGKNYVICDILGSWEQDKLTANDVIFAD